MNNKLELLNNKDKDKFDISRMSDFQLLWERAETLGSDVELKYKEKPWSESTKYEVKIHFTRSSGSNVYATGKSDDKIEALKIAIGEAITLKDN